MMINYSCCQHRYHSLTWRCRFPQARLEITEGYKTAFPITQKCFSPGHYSSSMILPATAECDHVYVVENGEL